MIVLALHVYRVLALINYARTHVSASQGIPEQTVRLKWMSVRAPLVVMVFAKTKSTLMYVNVLLDTLGYIVTYLIQSYCLYCWLSCHWLRWFCLCKRLKHNNVAENIEIFVFPDVLQGESKPRLSFFQKINWAFKLSMHLAMWSECINSRGMR